MKTKDDYSNWEAQYGPYHHNIGLLEKLYTVYLSLGDFTLDDEHEFVMKPDIKPLHVKWHTIYHAVLKLKATSVFEFGFGAGVNLHNLRALSPDMDIQGIDISIQQHAHAVAHMPHLADSLLVWNAADRLDSKYDHSVDIAFSRGVIMFLARHMEVLHNMFSVAKNQVVLLEGWITHDFYENIKTYSESPQFPWPSLYMYTYDTGEKDRQDTIRAMICSREPIETEWAIPLTSDAELRSN